MEKENTNDPAYSNTAIGLITKINELVVFEVDDELVDNKKKKDLILWYCKRRRQ